MFGAGRIVHDLLSTTDVEWEGGTMSSPLRVGVSRALLRPDGTIDLAELGLEGLETDAAIAWRVLDGDGPVASPADLAGLDVVVPEMIDIRASSLVGNDDLVLVARYGVGYDSVDLDACTERGILVTNAPDGVRRPMAAANLLLLLAISMRLVEKDRMTRTGRWEAGVRLLGSGLSGRTLGMVGMGNIGAETLRLVRPLDMRVLVFDPYVPADRIRAEGAEPADLDMVLGEADHLMLAVPLTAETHHLIGAPELARMKPTATIINTTRGAVIDEVALIDALRTGRLAGAALDVYEQEPVDAANPLLAMDNVIVTPHSVGSTDECFTLIGHSVVASILDVANGRIPRYVVNRDVVEHPRLRARLASRAAG